jgi:hypothetical protein
MTSFVLSFSLGLLNNFVIIGFVQLYVRRANGQEHGRRMPAVGRTGRVHQQPIVRESTLPRALSPRHRVESVATSTCRNRSFATFDPCACRYGGQRCVCWWTGAVAVWGRRNNSSSIGHVSEWGSFGGEWNEVSCCVL